MEEKKIKVGNILVNYKTFGEGKPLLILHGWGGSSNSWIGVAEIIAQKGFKVVCPDLPGFGKSQEPPKPWSVGDYVVFFADFTKALGLENFFLLGHSFGGGLALAFSAEKPQTVKMLILCGAAVIRKERLNFRQKIARFMAKGRELLLAVPIVGQAFYGLAQKIVYGIAGVKDYYRSTKNMRETFKNIVGEDLSKYAPEIKIPVLFVWGDKDKNTPLEDAYILQHLIVGSALEIIEETGHNPHRQKPQELAKKILAFIETR